MAEKWFLKNKKGDASALAGALHISPVLAKILINRDIQTLEQAESYLYGGTGALHSPALLKDCEKAAKILWQKIDAQKPIRIMGDYDCDGICATFILWRVLKEAGAIVDYCLPHRIKDGYGLNISMVEDAVQTGVDTILTCDNGIAAKGEIAYAKENGITVIVTDHHEVPFVVHEKQRAYVLPEADAIVNIKQEDDCYPFKGICGATTAWKLGQLLLGEGHPLIQSLLPYVALATVCDVMELVDENRILVREGLAMLNDKPPVGLEALLYAYDLMDKPVSAYHMGFVLGPCLNATGRLETAEYALKLLTMTDKEEAKVYATTLKTLNDTRKNLTMENSEKAISSLKATGHDKDKIIVVYLPDCHESLAGIIAGRIRENCHRPTLVFTKAEEGVKASGRSMECYDMFEELSKCKDLFTKFGGHKMAAGLSMASEDLILVLHKRLLEACTLEEKDFVEKVMIDVAMPMSQVSLDLAKELEVLEPFGTGNTKPLFAEKNMVLTGAQPLGQKGNAVRLLLKGKDGIPVQAMLFGDLGPFHQFLDEKFGAGTSAEIYTKTCAFPVSVIYTLQVNRFQMRESTQIQIKYYC